MLKAVIFDLDGVVADSHPIHEAAWKALFSEQGLDPAAMNLDFLYAGYPRRDILIHYLGPIEPAELKRLSRRKEELYNAASIGLGAKANIMRVLSELSAANIACGLATSGGRRRAHQTLEKLGIKRYFSAIVTAEDVKVPKPAPDVFLLAARQLGVKAREVVAIEDSVAGVQAVLAAGMKCVGVASSERIEDLRVAGAHEVISKLPAGASKYFERLFHHIDSIEVSNGTSAVIHKRG